MSQVNRKLVLVGPPRSGKTLLAHAWQNQIPKITLPPTLGAQVFHGTVHTNEGTMRLYVWDEPGDARYTSTLAAYERDCDAAMFCFDACDSESFGKCQEALHAYRLRSTLPNRLYLCANVLTQCNAVLLKEAAKFASCQGLEFVICQPLKDDIERFFQTICCAFVKKSCNGTAPTANQVY